MSNPSERPSGSPTEPTQRPQVESHLRSILKAFSWRIVATTTTTIIAFVATGRVGLALTIGGWEFFIKFFVYYGHERLWQLVPRGAVRKIFAQRKK